MTLGPVTQPGRVTGSLTGEPRDQSPSGPLFSISFKMSQYTNYWLQ